jgi:hypothetical protein
MTGFKGARRELDQKTSGWLLKSLARQQRHGHEFVEHPRWPRAGKQLICSAGAIKLVN